jgi:ABC-type multidrug transport system permease subunit
VGAVLVIVQFMVPLYKARDQKFYVTLWYFTAGLIWLFPLTFMSNAFVPLESMPGWLQPIAAWNPISSVVAAVRDLFGNIPPGYVPPDYWPLQHPIQSSLLWCAVILAVFVPLGVARYRHAASR